MVLENLRIDTGLLIVSILMTAVNISCLKIILGMSTKGDRMQFNQSVDLETPTQIISEAKTLLRLLGLFFLP